MTAHVNVCTQWTHDGYTHGCGHASGYMQLIPHGKHHRNCYTWMFTNSYTKIATHIKEYIQITCTHMDVHKLLCRQMDTLVVAHTKSVRINVHLHTTHKWPRIYGYGHKWPHARMSRRRSGFTHVGARSNRYTQIAASERHGLANAARPGSAHRPIQDPPSGQSKFLGRAGPGWAIFCSWPPDWDFRATLGCIHTLGHVNSCTQWVVHRWIPPLGSAHPGTHLYTEKGAHMSHTNGNTRIGRCKCLPSWIIPRR